MPKRKLDENSKDPVQITKHVCTNLCKRILSEDGSLKYDFMMSLKQIALSKIALSLWINGNIQQYDEQYKSVRLPVNFIENKISELHLFSTYTRTLVKVLLSMGDSVNSWMKYHDTYIFHDSTKNLTFLHIKSIRWNSRLRIDYGRTAKNMLANTDNSLSDKHKYRLACHYCLEEEIAIIAPKVVDRNYLVSLEFDRYSMIYFWTIIVTGDTRKYPIVSFFKRNEDFDCLNEVSMRYMWYRLSAEEKSENIARLIGNLSSQDFKYSLLSTISYEQQQQVFRKHSLLILRYMFTDWLWEEYFLPTALHVLNSMESEEYVTILRLILFNIERYPTEEKGLYASMFEVLWREGPMHMKDFALKTVKGILTNSSTPNAIRLYLLEYIHKDYKAE